MKSKNILKGFTLVEVIIVVVIIASLVLLAIAFFRGQIFKGNDARRKGDINRIKIGLEEYEKDHNCYPLSQTVVCNPGTGLTPYLDKIPCDPTTHASYYYEYENSSCPSWYRVYTKLENSSDTAIVSGIGPNGAFNYYSGSPNAPGATPGPSSAPAPSGGGGGGAGGQSGFYGCISGACVPISWDSNRPGPECDPNYQNATCYGSCGSPSNVCVPWH
jgi:prepilin-type N-terminal cleavage/methylation domain-containing protein